MVGVLRRCNPSSRRARCSPANSLFRSRTVFIAFMYYHCSDYLLSWPLMHAAVVVLGTATLFRFIVTMVQTAGFFKPQKAVVQIVEDKALRIQVKTSIKWQAGQYFYVRFTSPSLYPWQTHPFTAVSVPLAFPISNPTADVDPNLMSKNSNTDLEVQNSTSNRSNILDSSLVDFILRPHSGLTRRLFERASSVNHLNLSVILDGPYSSGSAELVNVACSDRALVIAGGEFKNLFPLRDALNKRTSGYLF